MSPHKARNNQKNILLTLGLFFLGVLIMFSTLRKGLSRISNDFFYPFLNTASKVEDTVSDKSLLLESKTTLASEVSRLTKENAELNTRLTVDKTLLEENNRLRELLELPKRPGYKQIPAEIILRAPEAWEKTFKVNKGSDDGVLEGAVVLTSVMNEDDFKVQSVVIGKVKSVSKHSAEVATLLSRECRLSVFAGLKRVPGLLTGGKRTIKGFRLDIKYLPKELLYQAGEKIYTSGFSSSTPAGLYVGVLSGKDSSDVKVYENLYAEGTVVPAADFEKVRYLMIIVGNNPNTGNEQ